MIGHPPPCPACGDPQPHPGAGYRCPAVTDRTNMTVCAAPPFCGPDCACPVAWRPGTWTNGRWTPGRYEHAWAEDERRLDRMAERMRELADA